MQKSQFKFESSLVYSDNINRIWTVLKDKTKVIDILLKMNFFTRLHQLITIKLDAEQEAKSNWNNIKCSELITNNFYKRIVYTITTHQNISLIFTFILYPNTWENSTLLMLTISHSLSFDIPQTTQNFNTFFSASSTQFLETFNHFLKLNPVFLYEYQSILINCDIEKIWNVLNNGEKLTSITEDIDQVFPMRKFKLGDMVSYKLKGDQIYAKITKMEKDKTKKKWHISFDLYDKDYTVKRCEINVIFLAIKEDAVFLSYHHDFKEPIEQSEWNELSLKKRRYWEDLKKYMDNMSTGASGSASPSANTNPNPNPNKQ